MPITSTHSFYCRNFGLEATAVALGEDLGACLTLFTSDEPTRPLTFFIDNVDYARHLAAAINAAAQPLPVEEAA